MFSTYMDGLARKVYNMTLKIGAQRWECLLSQLVFVPESAEELQCLGWEFERVFKRRSSKWIWEQAGKRWWEKKGSQPIKKFRPMVSITMLWTYTKIWVVVSWRWRSVGRCRNVVWEGLKIYGALKKLCSNSSVSLGVERELSGWVVIPTVTQTDLFREILFADDTAMVAHTKDQAQRLIVAFVAASKKWASK